VFASQAFAGVLLRHLREIDTKLTRQQARVWRRVDGFDRPLDARRRNGGSWALIISLFLSWFFALTVRGRGLRIGFSASRLFVLGQRTLLAVGEALAFNLLFGVFGLVLRGPSLAVRLDRHEGITDFDAVAFADVYLDDRSRKRAGYLQRRFVRLNLDDVLISLDPVAYGNKHRDDIALVHLFAEFR